MRGYLACERCGWSRIYARFSVARLPQFCPQCGRRVIRERNPTEASPTVAQWRAVAAELTKEPPPPHSHSHSPR
jgi:DNA-directed RNA polymerase subunit RPC12/RpoP